MQRGTEMNEIQIQFDWWSQFYWNPMQMSPIIVQSETCGITSKWTGHWSTFHVEFHSFYLVLRQEETEEHKEDGKLNEKNVSIF